MNYKQYYKSLFNNEDFNSPIKLIRKDKNKRRENFNNKIRSFDFKKRNKYFTDKIEELREESFE